MFATGTEDRPYEVRRSGSFMKGTFATMDCNLNSTTGKAVASLVFTGHPALPRQQITHTRPLRRLAPEPRRRGPIRKAARHDGSSSNAAGQGVPGTAVPVEGQLLLKAVRGRLDV
ncbi:hypothetical protein [Arthrobacter globiformis]|uniref:hypothetical protein n=1 Tax=Arthrobacter globiformis TaxID=1665 RepID=UPI002794BC08|nr:hypothetical protein [Arthrobacter globiformis]MDQ0617041.1 hypothetical protein [Arthrobacter globiformis]